MRETDTLVFERLRQARRTDAFEPDAVVLRFYRLDGAYSGQRRVVWP